MGLHFLNKDLISDMCPIFMIYFFFKGHLWPGRPKRIKKNKKNKKKMKKKLNLCTTIAC